MASRRKFDQVIIKDVLTEDEIFVREALAEVYPQLLANMYKVCGDGHYKWADDLLSVAIEYFLRYDLQKQVDTINSGKLEHFITFIANRQLKSGQTHYFTYYRKFNENMKQINDKMIPKSTLHDVNIEEDSEEKQNQESDAIQCMMRVKDTLDPFRKMIVDKLLLEGLTMRTVSRRYKINYYSLKAELPIVKQILREKCQHCFN